VSLRGARRPRRLVAAARVFMAAAVAAAAVLAGAGAAEARLIDLRAGLRAGGIIGWGSDAATPDFFDETRGGAMGFEIGAKLLVLDLSANFLQVINGDGRVGTLTQLLLGIEVDIPVGRGRSVYTKKKTILRPGLSGGFGFGTPGPVDPPLDNSQISDKGFVSQLKLGLEHFLTPYVGLGVEGDVGYHYFLGGTVVSLSNSKSFSSGYHMMALGTVTLHLGY
jgi:hypothetical protein